MNYINDILLNFNYEIYDFYEWNKKDLLTHIKKIPIFKIDKSKLNKIIINNVLFNDEFLDKIKYKTETYSKNKKTIKYAFLLTDGMNVLAINLNKKTKYSKLLLEEEIDILDTADKINITNINFKILNKKNIDEETKNEKESELILKNSIKNINNEDELKYLYYDCFNEKCNDINLIKNRLNKELLDNNIVTKINNFLNLKKCIKY